MTSRIWQYIQMDFLAGSGVRLEKRESAEYIW